MGSANAFKDRSTTAVCSFAVAPEISSRPISREFSTTKRHRSNRRIIKFANALGKEVSSETSSASTIPSSSAIPAPDANCGVVACEASPIKMTLSIHQSWRSKCASRGR